MQKAWGHVEGLGDMIRDVISNLSDEKHEYSQLLHENEQLKAKIEQSNSTPFKLMSRRSSIRPTN